MFTPEPSMDALPDSPQTTESTEFEFVLGKRQVASVSLVVLTALAGVSAAAYMAGKSVAKTVVVKQEVTKQEAPKSVVSPPAPAATTAAPAVAPPVDDEPLSGTPQPGKTYIQLGSVDRGFATLMAHGARKLGFHTFLTQGAGPNVYRVLSGPFATAADAQKAKATFDAMGLDTFSRKYEAPATPVTPEPAQP